MDKFEMTAVSIVLALIAVLLIACIYKARSDRVNETKKQEYFFNQCTVYHDATACKVVYDEYLKYSHEE